MEEGLKSVCLSVLYRVGDERSAKLLTPLSFYEENGELFIIYDSFFSSTPSSSSRLDDDTSFCHVRGYKKHLAQHHQQQQLNHLTCLKILLSASLGYRDLFRIFQNDKYNYTFLNLFVSLETWFLNFSGRKIDIVISGLYHDSSSAQKLHPGLVIKAFGEAILELFDLSLDELGKIDPIDHPLSNCKSLFFSCFETRVLTHAFDIIYKFFFNFHQILGGFVKEMEAQPASGKEGEQKGEGEKEKEEKEEKKEAMYLPAIPQLPPQQLQVKIKGSLKQVNLREREQICLKNKQTNNNNSNKNIAQPNSNTLIPTHIFPHRLSLIISGKSIQMMSQTENLWKC